jgi:uncharacterized phage-associated protein
MAAKYTCFEVANYYLKLAKESGSFISNLKLQKLVYYAQAWHLANYGEPLFEEDFQAWVHGPAIYALWKKYRKFGWQPISVDPEPLPKFDDKATALLDAVARVYLPQDAFALELMSHKEDPWVAAREGLASNQNGSTTISKKAIGDYFGKRLVKKA